MTPSERRSGRPHSRLATALVRRGRNRPPLAKTASIRRGEDGQSLVILVVALFAILVIAALAIDLSTWYQKHHQAQVAADSAALAAANCLANASTTSTSTTTTPTCTSTTDTTHADQVATTIAGDNGFTLTSAGQVNVNTTAGTVTVVPSGSPPSYLANIFGFHETVSATAVASYKPVVQSQNCTGQNCYAIFTQGTGCTAGSNSGVNVTNGTGTINGTVYTNSSVHDGGSVQFAGPVIYNDGGNPNNCAPTPNSGGTPPVVSATDYPGGATGEVTSTAWPIDYGNDTVGGNDTSGVFVPCPGTSSDAALNPVTCTGPGGTPNYCTVEVNSGNYTIQNGVANGVYCAVNGGTASNPGTWKGGFTLGGTCSGTSTYTLLAGSSGISSANTTGTCTWAPDVDGLFAAVFNNSQSNAFTLTNAGGSYNWTGTIFVPSGGVQITGGNITATTFLEAQYVDMTDGTISGGGPTVNGGSGGTVDGIDDLIQ